MSEKDAHVHNIARYKSADNPHRSLEMPGLDADTKCRKTQTSDRRVCPSFCTLQAGLDATCSVYISLLQALSTSRICPTGTAAAPWEPYACFSGSSFLTTHESRRVGRDTSYPQSVPRSGHFSLSAISWALACAYSCLLVRNWPVAGRLESSHGNLAVSKVLTYRGRIRV